MVSALRWTLFLACPGLLTQTSVLRSSRRKYFMLRLEQLALGIWDFSRAEALVPMELLILGYALFVVRSNPGYMGEAIFKATNSSAEP